jgi:hypothetical protein
VLQLSAETKQQWSAARTATCSRCNRGVATAQIAQITRFLTFDCFAETPSKIAELQYLSQHNRHHHAKNELYDIQGVAITLASAARLKLLPYPTPITTDLSHTGSQKCTHIQPLRSVQNNKQQTQTTLYQLRTNCYSTVQYSNCGRVSQTSALASERSLLMRVPRGPRNVPQSLRSGMQAIEITTKPAVNSSTR